MLLRLIGAALVWGLTLPIAAQDIVTPTLSCIRTAFPHPQSHRGQSGALYRISRPWVLWTGIPHNVPCWCATARPGPISPKSTGSSRRAARWSASPILPIPWHDHLRAQARPLHRVHPRPWRQRGGPGVSDGSRYALRPSCPQRTSAAPTPGTTRVTASWSPRCRWTEPPRAAAAPRSVPRSTLLDPLRPGERSRLAGVAWRRLGQFAFSSDDAWIAAQQYRTPNDSDVFLIHAKTGERQQILPAPGGPAAGMLALPGAPTTSACT